LLGETSLVTFWGKIIWQYIIWGTTVCGNVVWGNIVWGNFDWGIAMVLACLYVPMYI
jgi:hypothetical protein